jgi:2-oxoglutarate dehydrogenase E2 component (dihydrolipoamide succinyltransferase)
VIDVRVPALPESVPDAVLLEWRKRPGEAVASDELLIELETDKVVLEILAPAAGVLAEVVRPAGETVTSNEVIARIEERAGAGAAPGEREPQARAAAGGGKVPPASTAPAEASELSPAVRRLVAEHGLAPGAIAPTGRGGRITKKDVLDHLESRKAVAASPSALAPPSQAAVSPAPPAAPSPEAPPPAVSPAPGRRGERRVAMSRVRQRIAERLLESQQTAAILTTFNELNMQPVMDLRSRYKEGFEKKHGVRLGFMSFFAKAAVVGLQRFPEVNAYIEGSDIVYHDYYDIGIAVGSPRGLVVPVLRDVDRLSFADIERRINDFAARAQTGALAIDELAGGTFTISNGGVYGSLLSTPILNPPQSGILGMHKTEERPVVEHGAIVIRPMMYLALSYDHRIVDGREAVQFLIAIKESLEDPARMLLEV